jgi:hypothetical protein
MKIENFATLKDVPIFRAGTHNGEEYTSEDVDAMVESGNACSEYIEQSIQSGKYEGNENIVLTKSIPGLLNFAHQRYLKDTLKELSEGVGVKWGKQGEWLTATLTNVKNELAEFIKDRFPFRSVELIPELKIGDRIFKNVPRSIGFLPPDIMPAVRGQSPELVLEYQEDQFITLYSQTDEPPETAHTQEEAVMEDNEQQEGISVEEFRALAQEVQELRDRNTDLETEKGNLAERITQAEQERNKRDVVEFMRDLRSKNIKGADGVVYAPSKAFCDTVEPMISKTDASTVLEFEEGAKPARSVLMSIINEIVELAGKDGGMLVPLGDLAPQTHAAPDDEKVKKTVVELMKEKQKSGVDPETAWKQARMESEGGK